MRKTLMGLFGVVLLLSCALGAQTAKTAASTEMTLKDMETRWAVALLKSDAGAIGEMLADDFVGVSTEGKIQSRADNLSEAKMSKVTRSTVSDMRVRSFGAAAIVSGVWSGAGTDPAGKKFDTTSRWTDVFVMRAGKWKCVSSHSTTIQK